MNIAFGWRAWDAMRIGVDRIEAAGLSTTAPLGPPPVGFTYIIEPDRHLELLAIPEQTDAEAGFLPLNPLLGNGMPHRDPPPDN